MKIHAYQFHKTGGPEVLKWEEIDLPAPGRGEVLIRHTAIGFNFVDTYFRSGTFPVRSLPAGIGTEGVGVIEAAGPGVTEVKPSEE